jgi:hypothetical protein
MKIAQVGTALVVLHTITHGLHGLAHVKIPIPLSALQSWFISGVILLAPIVAAVLLWTPFHRVGSWLLLSSMTGAILFGLYNHLLVISPDHISHVALSGWGWLFQITAMLTLIVDGCGCWSSIQALSAAPPSKTVF